jgi:Domain of unknown function (DUF929)
VVSRTSDGNRRPSDKNAAKSSAQARIAAARVAQKKDDRRRNVLMTGGTVVAVIVVVAIVVVIGLNTKSKAKSGDAVVAASSSVTKAIANVPTTAFDTVDLNTSGYSAPPKAVTGEPALTANGLPEVLYMGAEYCPFCAAERWPLAVALSRFGTFTGLKQTTSSASDSPASVPTLSFYGSTYTSKYINFTSVEMQTNQVDSSGSNYTVLQTPTAAQQALLTKLDVSTDGSSSGGIPFIDFGNKYAQVDGANYQPTLLTSPLLTQEQVAASISQPTSKSGAAILATANAISSYICKIDGNQPASVCNSKGVTTTGLALIAASATG